MFESDIVLVRVWTCKEKMDTTNYITSNSTKRTRKEKKRKEEEKKKKYTIVKSKNWGVIDAGVIAYRA